MAPIKDDRDWRAAPLCQAAYLPHHPWMELGQTIRRLRKKHGATLEELAFLAKTDASNLSRIERGTQHPSKDMLHRIAQGLNTSVAAIYAATGGSAEGPVYPSEEPDDTTPMVQQLRQYFRKLSPENQQLAVRFVKMLNQMQREVSSKA